MNVEANLRRLSLSFYSFFFEDVEKKVWLKSPKLHTPRKMGTSLGLWGSTSLRVNKPPLHCGGVPSHWRPSLVASLHSEGPHTIVGGQPGSGADGWPVGSRVRRCGLFGSWPTGG